ncbi:MAG TPA: LCP family protein [Patescibacteria group bacterium]|nr:LCP family protein [Patescibacteria group bacterium]
MEPVRIDFLKQTYRLDAEKPRAALFFVRLFAAAILFTAVGGAVFSYQVASSGTGADSGGFVYATLRHFIQADEKKMQGEENDRINVLLLGVGGEGHEGAELSDTILLASLQPSTNKLGLLSLPRDLAVPIPGYDWRKVNSANAYGESEKDGYGPVLASQVIGNVLDQEIPYYIKVDFNGFETLIDKLGGIDVYVDRPFTDAEYPILGRETTNCGTTETLLNEQGEEIAVPTYGCRFEVLAFQEGWAHMDGATALQYARSRHGTNGEASDFARSRRQQKILTAVKEKTLQVDTLLHPTKISALFDTVREHVQTNLAFWEIIRLADFARKLDSDKIVSRVLDASPDSPLYATSINGAYMLLPKNDDWGAVRGVAVNLLDVAYSAEGEKPPKPKFVRIEIQNGTKISGLAFETSQLLREKGYNVVKIDNAAERGYTHTVIYDLTNGRQAEDLHALQEMLQADISMSASGWLFSADVYPKELTMTDDVEEKATADRVDFLVILGENGTALVKK